MKRLLEQNQCHPAGSSLWVMILRAMDDASKISHLPNI
jgi:hypothetical protein